MVPSASTAKMKGIQSAIHIQNRVGRNEIPGTALAPLGGPVGDSHSELLGFLSAWPVSLRLIRAS